MHPLRSAAAGLLAVLCLAACPGCLSRAAKEALGAVEGGEGVVAPLTGAHRSLGQYDTFEYEAFRAAPGVVVPPTIEQRLPQLLTVELAERGIPTAGGQRRVIIRGTYIYFEDSRAVTEQIFGPFEEVIARVELVDAASGETLASANCVGRSTQSVNQGPGSKAQGLAEAIAKWIGELYP